MTKESRIKNKESREKSNKTKDEKKAKKEEKKLSREEYKEKYLRALADYQNLLKRSAEEKQVFAKYANEQFLMEVLPVYDNLKVALDHADETVKNNGWAKGIEYVIKQFKDFLVSQGVEEIKTQGEKFDHKTMEALKVEGEKVKKELKAGYLLKGKVIVAAKVELEK